MNGWEIFNIFLRTFFSSGAGVFGALITGAAVVAFAVFVLKRQKRLRLLAIDLERVDKQLSVEPNSTSLLIERATIQLQRDLPMTALSDLEAAYKQGIRLDGIHDLFWIAYGIMPVRKVQLLTTWAEVKSAAPSLSEAFQEEFDTVGHRKLLLMSMEKDLNQFRRQIGYQKDGQ